MSKAAHNRAAGPRPAATAGRADFLRPETEHATVLSGLLPYVWPKNRPDLRRLVVLACVSLIAAKLITIMVPIVFKWVVDELTARGANGATTGPAAAAAGLAYAPVALILAYGLGRILMRAFDQIRDVLFTKVGQNAVRELNTRTFRHLHALSLRFHLERRTGGLSRVIERGTRGIDLIMRMGVLSLVPTVLELLLVCGLLISYFSWQYAVLVMVMILVYLAFTFQASNWRISIRREMNDSDNDANTKAIDSLLNYETVKYFGNEEHEARRFDASMGRYTDAAVKTYYSLGVLNAGQAAIFTVGLTLCMVLSARAVVAGTQTVGDFVMINAMLIQLYIPLNFMGMIYREIKQGLVDLETMFALMAEHPEIKDKPDATPLVVKNGTVRFENVDFRYEPDRAILKGVSFEVPAGKMVAIVGPSGAGKSTISRILFRFYDVAAGRVTIDGADIRDVTQASLRAAIGVVPQDTVLFNDTIAYNIRYGRPSASEEEIREAAKLAQIDDFINQLPQGYKTSVGERGLKLSGGEKQRVAIARTILKAPPILMLDEATSALDSHTEREIQDALDRVAKNRTTLVIAHRLSTIVHADMIIVLEKGVIVEQGTHAELMQNNGLYASMWARQREAEKAREQLAQVLEEEAKLEGEKVAPKIEPKPLVRAK